MSENTSLKIDFKNCYGIKSLKKEFDFSKIHSTFSIYASNGSMKTSFAKTFEDISKEKQPTDLIYSKRETSCEIKFDNQNIKPSQIFVIHSYNKNYQSEKVSTLLANKELRIQYEKVYKEINNQKNIFLKGLKKVCGVTNLDEIEENISKVFYNNETGKFFESLERIKTEVNADEVGGYKGIKYKDIFDEKVKTFLNNPDIQKNIAKYIEKYDELLDSSTYFKKGIFNHSQAEDTANQLKKNGFFKAEHAVLFGDKKLSTEQELTGVINEEKEKILTDETLKKTFSELDKKIKNAELKKLRDFLSEHPFIIAGLDNLESFEAKLWKYYIKENQDNFNQLLLAYSKGKKDIAKISEEAKQEKTKWQKVIDIFNIRFVVPFKITIGNKAEVILEEQIPSIAFEFVEQDERQDVKREKLLEVLSQGEKRALYLLDIIFEIEARKDEKYKHLFVIDDIADSFDYKNKYAIIEYLRDVSKVDNFYQIILSHNFDFHRTISSRLSMKRENKLSVIKSNNEIELKKEHYQNNPFNHWKDNLDDKYCLIASIPFVRNLAEYTQDIDVYNNLTNFIHIKKETESLTLINLKDEFKKVLKEGADNISAIDNFLSFLEQAANGIPDIDENDRKLEHKIVLAIAIRLNAEKFMIDKINDSSWVSSIKECQTAELTDKYKEKFSKKKTYIKTLDKVQLMTPESIHLNSFMFEPLLDMSDDYLIKLFKEVQSMNSDNA